MSACSAVHEDRAQILDTLSKLLGCRLRLPGLVLGGLIPDVAAVDPASRTLFLGDAKATETPGCEATRQRLQAYVAWLAAATDSGCRTIIMLCVDSSAAPRWRAVLSSLVAEAGLACELVGFDTIERDTAVAWVLVSAHIPEHLDKRQFDAVRHPSKETPP